MVEWKKLGELCRIRTGKLNANAQEENGIYPFFTCDSKPYKINNYAFDTEAILISGNGSQVGHLNYYKGKFNAYQRTYVLDDFHGHIFFILHYLKCRIREYIFEKSKKGSVPYITLPMLTDFLIPIPSISEQERIVGILDTFTASIDNIKVQIEQRRKQYEHYRNTLLTFNKDDDSVEWKTLGEVAEIGTGSGNTNESLAKGLYPFYTRGQEILRKNEYEYDEQAVVTAGDGVGVGKVIHYVEGKYALHQRAYRFCPKKNLNTKFLFYYMKVTFYKYVCGNAVASSVSSLRKPKLQVYPIPIPSLQEQQRIVSILDTFEASINNLEAQLEQRQKQYEYYREELLTNLS